MFSVTLIVSSYIILPSFGLISIAGMIPLERNTVLDECRFFGSKNVLLFCV